MFLPFQYLQYLWKAKGRHGFHSPFVYEFTDECLTTKIDKNFEKNVNLVIQKIKNSSVDIEMKDFGAGSKKLIGSKRKINAIYKNASTKGKYAKLLYKISKHYKYQNILEFGTSLGFGSVFLHADRNDIKILSVEACPQTLAIAHNNFDVLELKNITTINDTFSSFLDQKLNVKFDLIFVDGHHDGQALIEYMEKLENISHNDTLFILDDIRWSKSMFEAWNTLMKNEKYHVSMDLFKMGILLKRPQQTKEHFIVRY